MLTGVGLYTEPRVGRFIAPPDPDARWDDPGYERPEEDGFGAMTDNEWNGRRGFVFHDACWSLLRHAFHPAPIPLMRVFEVCDSLPKVMTGDSINWGHDYGGLALLRHGFFPWEERFVDRQFPDGWFNTPYSAEPLVVSEVHEILADTPQAVLDKITPASSPPGQDPFNLLPVELCLVIALYLPTPDALSARLASRSFWLIFSSQHFWASRSKGGLDRSWLFEAWHRNNVRDWRWLYHRTTNNRLTPGLRNRKRIWGLIQHFAVLLELPLHGFSSELSPPWKVALEPNWEWVFVGGNTKEAPFEFSQLQKGCRRLRSKQLAVPGGILRVSASTVRVGNLVYIAGITLATAAGEVLELGYSGAGERSVKVSGLAGLNVAVGLGGIHAVQCINAETEAPSPWLGCPLDAPKTERLILGARIVGLEVGFDVRYPLHFQLPVVAC